MAYVTPRAKLRIVGEKPPPPAWHLLEHAPAPTVTVAQANKRQPAEMPLAGSQHRNGRRARRRGVLGIKPTPKGVL